MKKLIVLTLLITIAFLSYAEVEEWYKLKDNETYLNDFLLPAGESKKVSLDATEPTQINFLTDAAYEENGSEVYRELSGQYGYEVVKFSNLNTGGSISTVWGGGTIIEPIENKILVELTNLIDKDFKVVIYTEEEEEEEEGEKE